MTTKNQEVGKAAPREVQGEAQRMDNRPVYAPATDVYEREDAIVIVSDMPGVSEKDLDIHLEDDVLRIAGCRTTEEVQGHDALYREVEAGNYERSFTLTGEINREGIKATVRNGVLRVILPKAEKARPRKISVQAE